MPGVEMPALKSTHGVDRNMKYSRPSGDTSPFRANVVLAGGRRTYPVSYFHPTSKLPEARTYGCSINAEIHQVVLHPGYDELPPRDQRVNQLV